MVKLLESDIRTRDVLSWKGLHLFHGQMSSCSQKLRTYLAMKGIAWESHPLDLSRNENLSERYLGINPRGLVPVLVHDGAVHIESNDIILYLEHLYPDPPMVPPAAADALDRLLDHENRLHMDLRVLSFRFLFAPTAPPKSAAELDRYETAGSGTVLGKRDAHIAEEVAFWRGYAADGIPDGTAKASAAAFREAFDALDRSLATAPFLMGETFSILDIAWIIYAERLRLAGYPLARLHPRFAAWLTLQTKRPEVAPEIALPPRVAAVVAERQRAMADAGRTLDQVCFEGSRA